MKEPAAEASSPEHAASAEDQHGNAFMNGLLNAYNQGDTDLSTRGVLKLLDPLSFPNLIDGGQSPATPGLTGLPALDLTADATEGGAVTDVAMQMIEAQDGALPNLLDGGQIPGIPFGLSKQPPPADATRGGGVTDLAMQMIKAREPAQ